ncbi:hypothetical protein [Streptomyces sp. NPDC048516]|uniref:hypothetical protein n=1 Tax=Streptomyces sp. NPDC048516 TaxID=3365565 RepID=UPI0037174E68
MENFAFTLPKPTTPDQILDEHLGRGDANDEHHTERTTLPELEHRLECYRDPRISGTTQAGASKYTAAYCRGYQAYIEDAYAAEWLSADLAYTAANDLYQPAS